MSMKLSTGKIAFPIEFDNGEKANIYINPYDREFVKKILNFESSMKKKIDNLKFEKYQEQANDGIDLNINFDNPEEIMQMTPEQIDSLKNKITIVSKIDEELQDAFKEELNEIFESDISSTIFKYCQPLDVVFIDNDESELYIVQFVKAFVKELKKYTDKQNDAINKHIGKYKK